MRKGIAVIIWGRAPGRTQRHRQAQGARPSWTIETLRHSLLRICTDAIIEHLRTGYHQSIRFDRASGRFELSAHHVRTSAAGLLSTGSFPLAEIAADVRQQPDPGTAWAQVLGRLAGEQALGAWLGDALQSSSPEP